MVRRPDGRTFALYLMLLVVLAFAVVTIVSTNNLRLAGTVDRMACVMKYGSKALSIGSDQFNLGGKAYDLGGQTDRPSLHPLCLVPLVQYFDTIPVKGNYADARGNAYVALDLAAVDRAYSAARDANRLPAQTASAP